jgi:hypothetical protein
MVGLLFSIPVAKINPGDIYPPFMLNALFFIVAGFQFAVPNRARVCTAE